MKQLNFPSYEWLKALPIKRMRTFTDRTTGESFDVEEHCEYKFTLFDTPVYVYGQLSYNEDDSRYIYFDVMENGYSNMNNYGLSLKFNKANYKKLCKHAQEMYEMFYRELEQDVSYQWDCEPEEYLIDKYPFVVGKDVLESLPKAEADRIRKAVEETARYMRR